MWIFGSTIPEKNRQSGFPKPPDYPIVVRKPCLRVQHGPWVIGRSVIGTGRRSEAGPRGILKGMEQADPRRAKPMTLIVQLSDDIERRLRERASRQGRAVEEYIVELIEREAGQASPAATAPSFKTSDGVTVSDEELEQLLNELAAGPELPLLPATSSGPTSTPTTTDARPCRLRHPVAAPGALGSTTRTHPHSSARPPQQRRCAVIGAENAAEFWNVCTRPVAARGGLGLTVAETDRRLRIIERLFPLIPESAAVYHAWRGLLVAHGVQGVQVHDARLVASCKFTASPIS